MALAEHLRALEPAIRSHFARICPDMAHWPTLRTRPIGRDASHAMAVIEAADHPTCRLLAKGAPRHAGVRQSLAKEATVLAEITPKIRAHNSHTRSPEMIAYYPDRDVLLLELVPGVRLDVLVFGIGLRRQAGALPATLGLAAQWLSAFHTIMRSGDRGNPFDRLAERFERPSTRTVFSDYGGLPQWTEILRLLDSCRRRYGGHQETLTTIHGEFAPYHVLVDGDVVYVIDLASSDVGHPFEDVAFFTTFYDMALPWRRCAAAFREPIETQQEIFLRAYFAGRPRLTEVERAVMRFARIHAATRFAGQLVAPETTLRRLAAAVAKPWVSQRLRHIWHVEIEALAAQFEKVRP